LKIDLRLSVFYLIIKLLKKLLIFHSKTNNRVTVVGEYCDEGLCLTAARCSSKDNFCRKTGRDIANRRFNIKRHCITIPVKNRNIKSFVEIAANLSAIISNDPSFKKNMEYYKENIIQPTFITKYIAGKDQVFSKYAY